LSEYDNAETELSSAIAKGSVEANLTLGKVYETLGDTDTAENYYLTYLQSEDADSEAFNLLAEIAMNRGDYEQALDYISQGLEAETVSDRRALLSNQIIAYEQLSDFASAWEVIQEYVALYPDDLNAQREYTFLKYRNVQE
jgi:tetratricopeptide (TPR) repeat protein